MLTFFFNDTATPEIYTLSLHDALPIFASQPSSPGSPTSIRIRSGCASRASDTPSIPMDVDRKSTRLNSSHANISYAVFCLKKKQSREDADRFFQFTGRAFHDDVEGHAV